MTGPVRDGREHGLPLEEITDVPADYYQSVEQASHYLKSLASIYPAAYITLTKDVKLFEIGNRIAAEIEGDPAKRITGETSLQVFAKIASGAFNED